MKSETIETFLENIPEEFQKEITCSHKDLLVDILTLIGAMETTIYRTFGASTITRASRVVGR